MGDIKLKSNGVVVFTDNNLEKSYEIDDGTWGDVYQATCVQHDSEEDEEGDYDFQTIRDFPPEFPQTFEKWAKIDGIPRGLVVILE